MKRFWDKVVKTDNCWNWTAYKLPGGYGQFGYNGSKILAHRLSWELVNGPVPLGLFVLHKCDNTACVNPDHLFLGTKADNNLDKKNKGRQARGATCSLTKFAEEDALVIRALHFWSGFSSYEIAEELKMSQSNVSAIIRGKTWKHVRTNFST